MYKKEIPICYCGGNTVLISKNISIINEKEKYSVNGATVEKCNNCGDMFIQDRTIKLVEKIVGYCPHNIEQQIFQCFN